MISDDKSKNESEFHPHLIHTLPKHATQCLGMTDRATVEATNATGLSVTYRLTQLGSNVSVRPNGAPALQAVCTRGGPLSAGRRAASAMERVWPDAADAPHAPEAHGTPVLDRQSTHEARKTTQPPRTGGRN